jgi:hypothetical protein
MIIYESDEEFQQCFLNFFNITEYDESKIQSRMDELFPKAQKVPELKFLMKKAAGELLSEDEEIGFQLLFSYHYLKQAVPLLTNI